MFWLTIIVTIREIFGTKKKYLMLKHITVNCNW